MVTGGNNSQEANLLYAALLRSQRGTSTLCPWGLLWDDSALPLPADRRWGMPSNWALKMQGLDSVLPSLVPWLMLKKEMGMNVAKI